MKTFYIVLQKITLIYRIHNHSYSYGWKIPFIDYAYFDNYGLKKIPLCKNKDGKILKYHNCTLTGKY